MDYRDLVGRARNNVREVTPADCLGLTFDSIIDVRELEERQVGAIPGSLFLPRGVLERDIEQHIPDRDTSILLYCSGGQRSVLAAAALAEMGYTDVASLDGGFDRWRLEGQRWESPAELSTEQRIRYDRHIRLAEIGPEGQERLLQARVLVVGAGGLGSPLGMYLAAAGVGTIGIVDDDIVDPTNLQRQIIHSIDSIGSQKVESARERIQSLNPDVKVESHSTRLNAANAAEIMSAYDIIVDGSDNFPTRYLINDAALRLRRPVVHGSILRFEGQVAVFTPYQGPCYRCLFREPPPPDLAPSCAEAGVLGALPGVVGSIMSVEAVKMIVGAGETLRGRLLVYDGLEQRFDTLNFARDPSCPACSNESRPPPLRDYDATCRMA